MKQYNGAYLKNMVTRLKLPEELISYNWQEENTEKFDEIIKLNEDIYEKCSIPIVKTYNISDEFK